MGPQQVTAFLPGQAVGDAGLTVERYGLATTPVSAAVRFVADPAPRSKRAPEGGPSPRDSKPPTNELVLFTNGRGGMARLQVDLGAIHSKYDCLLGANFHDSLPVDRHVFAKRARAWINADGFITALDAQNLIEFTPGPPARWRFVASAGDDRAVEIVLTADMLAGLNTTVLRFHRPNNPAPIGRELDPACRVSLTVRVDIE
ncbi:MAG TPA: amylo-alpha-1,6-glucosidase, partial [Candidatus Dormibacteraeota bacterium]|nr:amylo-alpha-1,6-glucosidase [Candidatus Dormibacteraeota bacterium]